MATAEVVIFSGLAVAGLVLTTILLRDLHESGVRLSSAN
jgi:hypothetical protein